MAKEKVRMSAWDYINKVLLKSAYTTILAFLLPGLLCLLFPDSFLRLVEVCVASVFGSLLAIYFAGMDKFEREFVVNMIRRRVSKHS